MGMVTIYKEDYKYKPIWDQIVRDLGLPIDTDEICVKHVSHITKSMRTKNIRKNQKVNRS